MTSDRVRVEDAHDDSATLAAAAVEAARSVGDLLREGFRSTVPADTKADFHDLVTEHDRNAEMTIRTVLSTRVPGSRIVGEESGVAGDGAVTWYVDPIDGTNNFASGVPFFCVSIGATLAGRLVAGVVYDPVRDELFVAGDDGATLNGVPIEVRDTRSDAAAVLATDFPTHDTSRLAATGIADFDRLATMVRSFRTVRRLGSGALMLAYVAAGRLDVTLGTTAKPWDVAAGALLVEAAGGRYLSLHHAEDDNQHPWETRAYLAHGGDFDLDHSYLRTFVDDYTGTNGGSRCSSSPA